MFLSVTPSYTEFPIRTSNTLPLASLEIISTTVSSVIEKPSVLSKTCSDFSSILKYDDVEVSQGETTDLRYATEFPHTYTASSVYPLLVE